MHFYVPHLNRGLFFQKEVVLSSEHDEFYQKVGNTKLFNYIFPGPVVGNMVGVNLSCMSACFKTLEEKSPTQFSEEIFSSL